MISSTYLAFPVLAVALGTGVPASPAAAAAANTENCTAHVVHTGEHQGGYSECKNYEFGKLHRVTVTCVKPGGETYQKYGQWVEVKPGARSHASCDGQDESRDATVGVVTLPA
jgi:hypothetical protein